MQARQNVAGLEFCFDGLFSNVSEIVNYDIIVP